MIFKSWGCRWNSNFCTDRADLTKLRLLHRLFRFGHVPDPIGPASLGGGAGAGGAAREGVSKAGGMVVLGAICPLDRPHGPTVFLTGRRVRGPWTGLVSTRICRGSSSSPFASPSWSCDEDPIVGATKAWAPTVDGIQMASMTSWRGVVVQGLSQPIGGRWQGPLQHPRSGWRRRRLWWCRGWATVAPATTTTVASVAWIGDSLQQGYNQLGEFPLRHPYWLISTLFDLSLCS
jgi:hypothetical protein